jgi:hypothetical protein
MRLVHTFTIRGNGGAYLGSLFAYKMKTGELRFTHSIANHGMALFATTEAAESDFFATKQRLPEAVHRIIFGTA